MVEFKNKTLTYYRGNYDTFEAVRSEKIKNQRRLYEANQAKRAHMQDFIDKFRALVGGWRWMCGCVALSLGPRSVPASTLRHTSTGHLYR